MKYKVGDKVRIKSKDWYERNKKEDGYIRLSQRYFNEDMCMYCGKIATIEEINTWHGYISYKIDIDNCHFYWDDEMFDDEVPSKIELGDTFIFEGKLLKAVDKGFCNECFFRNLQCASLFAEHKRPRCDKFIFKEVNENEIPNNKVMEKRNIKIDIETAKKWYRGDNESLKTLAKQAFTVEELEKDELPSTWKEFCNNTPIKNGEFYIKADCDIEKRMSGAIRDIIVDKSTLPSKESAESHLALMQLEQLRDCYRQGWKPDWKDSHIKYCIYISNNGIFTDDYTCYRRFLSFQSPEIRNKFLENFKDLIEQAKEYI